jgi:hypothetical protein
MSISFVTWFLVLIAFVAANLPWLSERFFFIFAPPGGSKRFWMRLLEWLVLLLLVGLIAAGLENKSFGTVYAQAWEFYTVAACLFVVFALPGFIYRHELKRLLDRR